MMQVNNSTSAAGIVVTRAVAKAEENSKGALSTSVPASLGAASASVSLSADALLYLGAARSALLTQTEISRYQQFFPAREGFDTQALAASTLDPSMFSSSVGKSTAEVATDARARMDEKYADMAASGESFAWLSVEHRDRNALMGDLDRRSLAVIRENEGGLFSKEEQQAAAQLMDQQQGLAMGLYVGPLSQAGQFSDPYGDNHTARFKAAGSWLDKVSLQEKSTGTWLQQRSAVASQERLSGRSGRDDEIEPMSLVDILLAADREQAEEARRHGKPDRSSDDAFSNSIISEYKEYASE
ncbi:hypothetical protein [Agrobacterium sp. NPDC089420]|uniref:hypothetical protein n=1 Tax=Agrobacterium sp. NPDC089420 TaxID=3363918 RepID=UPI00384DE71C